MTVRWLRVAAEDLTRLLAAQPSRQAQRDFLLKLRQALAGIDTRAPPAKGGTDSRHIRAHPAGLAVSHCVSPPPGGRGADPAPAAAAKAVLASTTRWHLRVRMLQQSGS